MEPSGRTAEPSVALVAELSPFRGVRYDCARLGTNLEALAAPPYDVIDDDQRVALEANHDANSVRLILPQDDTTPGDRYARAAATMQRWAADGLLTRDPSDRLYGYRMDFSDSHGAPAHTVGVLGALMLPERAGEGGILPHERTIPKAKSDRLDLLRATRANLDPIWGLSPSTGLTALIDGSRHLDGDGSWSCVDEDGVRHVVFPIDEPVTIEAIRAAIRAHPLVLADGHHRFETAIAYRNERRASNVHRDGDDHILCLVVELTEHELCIQAIHRLVTLPCADDVFGALGDAFVITPAGANSPDGVDALEARMHHDNGIGLVVAESLFCLVPRPDVCDPELAACEPEAVRDTDAALVEAVIVPRLADAQWRYRHDLHEVAALVRKGEASIGILVRPVSVAQTRAAALAGVRMPQKTTFFYPKPRTGMVLRTLD
jgi:uncharacterized protein (DUF1015 family)